MKARNGLNYNRSNVRLAIQRVKSRETARVRFQYTVISQKQLSQTQIDTIHNEILYRVTGMPSPDLKESGSLLLRGALLELLHG